MATIPPSRLSSLLRLRSTIFQTSYNPTSLRTGAKYLRARLRGPSMVQYYPEEPNISAIARRWRGAWKAAGGEGEGLVNMVEMQRLEDLRERQARGKGTPKKAKTKADSRRAHRKR